MPAFGLVLIILGLFLLLRTVRHVELPNGQKGGLVEKLIG
jgi:hypothetical protein